MNRKLMAVAVAGVFAAPAIALAQSSTVQIYGRITYEYGYADQGGQKPSTDIAQTPGGSAIGFRGEEKLGGGLTAWFQCESSADVRGISQDGLCTRNSAIGFKGAWGNLHFGRWDSPFKRAVNMGTVGVLDTGLLGHSFVFAGGSGGTDATDSDTRNRWKRRDVGWTYYESPNFSGFQILAGFTPGNGATAVTDTTTAQKPRVLSIAGTFKQGPFAVGLGYEQHSDFTNRATVQNPLGGSGTVSTTTLRTAPGDDSAWTISASYTFMNKITVGAAYLDAEYETGAATKLKKKNFLVGIDWKIGGPHSVHLGYVNADDSKGNSTTTIGDVQASGPSTGADWYSIAYQYAFSKRTTARIGYVSLDNDQNSKYALGGTRVATAGENQDAIVLYLQHNF